MADAPDPARVSEALASKVDVGGTGKALGDITAEDARAQAQRLTVAIASSSSTLESAKPT